MDDRDEFDSFLILDDEADSLVPGDTRALAEEAIDAAVAKEAEAARKEEFEAIERLRRRMGGETPGYRASIAPNLTKFPSCEKIPIVRFHLRENFGGMPDFSPRRKRDAETDVTKRDKPAQRKRSPLTLTLI